MKIVALDWHNEFKFLSNEGFIRAIDSVLRVTKWFPTIADITKALDNTGLCENCIYTNACDMEKKTAKDQGKTCDSFIKK